MPGIGIVRPAAAVAAGYVALSLAGVGIAMVRDVAGLPILFCHVVLLGALLAAAGWEGSGAMKAAADWLPLAVIPLLYAELPVVMAGFAPIGGMRYFDAAILDWERFLAGSPARDLAVLLPHRPLSELLHLAYFLYYPLIYVPPLLLYLRGERTDFSRAVTALVATFAVCFAVFVIYPVQGPRYFGTAPAPSGFVRDLVLGVLEAGSSRGAAFPSSHVAVAMAQVTVAALRRSRLTPVYAIVTAGLSVGAVYGGFHYAVDVMAGAALGIAVPLLLSTRAVVPVADVQVGMR